eukprot:6883266-Alexandrium_andersonii.AAC.1
MRHAAGSTICSRRDCSKSANERRWSCVELEVFQGSCCVGRHPLARTVEKIGCLLYTSPSPRD